MSKYHDGNSAKQRHSKKLRATALIFILLTTLCQLFTDGLLKVVSVGLIKQIKASRNNINIISVFRFFSYNGRIEICQTWKLWCMHLSNATFCNCSLQGIAQIKHLLTAYTLAIIFESLAVTGLLLPTTEQAFASASQPNSHWRCCSDLYWFWCTLLKHRGCALPTVA